MSLKFDFFTWYIFFRLSNSTLESYFENCIFVSTFYFDHWHFYTVVHSKPLFFSFFKKTKVCKLVIFCKSVWRFKLEREINSSWNSVWRKHSAKTKKTKKKQENLEDTCEKIFFNLKRGLK